MVIIMNNEPKKLKSILGTHLLQDCGRKTKLSGLLKFHGTLWNQSRTKGVSKSRQECQIHQKWSTQPKGGFNGVFFFNHVFFLLLLF